MTLKPESSSPSVDEQHDFINRFVHVNGYGGYSEARQAWARRQQYLDAINSKGMDAGTYLQHYPDPDLRDEFQKLELI
ncbi:hypothetical protein HYW36_02690 [Candidatus Saccharibacteria bacterium]|nr:hypothetical protein [Candidatus Saccharibacteria bacterium]